MKITLKVAKASSLEVDSLNIFVFEDELKSGFKDYPPQLVDQIREAITRENFSGKSGEKLILSSKGSISSYKLIITGCGKKADFDIINLSEQVAKSMRTAMGINAVKVGVRVTDEVLQKNGVQNAIQTICESVNLSTYRFLRYISSEEIKKSRTIEEVIINVNPGSISQAEEGIKIGTLMAKATLNARDLINEPSQVTTPGYLAEEALKIGKASQGGVKVNIVDEEEIAKLGMNAFLGVARGSDQPSKLIILKYKYSRPRKKIVLVGKGITFDTGGLSLKSAGVMETMKMDMAGAASILGIFSVISSLKPAVEAVGLIPACENMPSGKALKPGDILTAMNGKTIEVINTDAEGRLTLADALSYALKKEKPDEIIDLATLTGACMVALGEDIAGLFGNNERLLTNIEKIARDSGERIWRMPLEEKYKDLLKSQIADLRNVMKGKYGGAITAALFLREFVDNIPWAHLDIAGPAFMEKDTDLCPYGGSGFGVRLILHYLLSI